MQADFLLSELLRKPEGGNESACNAGDLGSIPGLKDPLEESMASTSVFLPGQSPRTEEPGRLQSMGSQRVGHD